MGFELLDHQLEPIELENQASVDAIDAIAGAGRVGEHAQLVEDGVSLGHGDDLLFGPRALDRDVLEDAAQVPEGYAGLGRERQEYVELPEQPREQLDGPEAPLVLPGARANPRVAGPAGEPAARVDDAIVHVHTGYCDTRPALAVRRARANVDIPRRSYDAPAVPRTYEYPRPAVTVDIVVFTMRAEDLAVLLIRRAADPFEGAWALPGGFVEENEALEKAAARELAEETSLTSVGLEQLGAFGAPGRDPRGHTVSIVFYTFVAGESAPIIVAGDDAAEAAWHPLRTLPLRSSLNRVAGPPAAPLRRGEVPPAPPSAGRAGKRTPMPRLAFDHATILEAARQRLQERLAARWRDPELGFDAVRELRFQLVPVNFTLAELQGVYEAILGHTIDRRRFRARLLAQKMVEPLTTPGPGKSRSELFRWTTLPRAPTSTPRLRSR